MHAILLKPEYVIIIVR